MQSVLAGGVSREIRPLFWYLTHSAIKRFSVAPRFCPSEESKIKPVLAGAVGMGSTWPEIAIHLEDITETLSILK